MSESSKKPQETMPDRAEEKAPQSQIREPLVVLTASQMLLLFVACSLLGLLGSLINPAIAYVFVALAAAIVTFGFLGGVAHVKNQFGTFGGAVAVFVAVLLVLFQLGPPISPEVGFNEDPVVDRTSSGNVRNTDRGNEDRSQNGQPHEPKKVQGSENKLVAVPDVLGHSVTRAKESIANAGLTPIITYRETICYPSDLVIEQDDGELPVDQKVNLVVSKMRTIEGSLVGFRYGRNLLLDLKPREYGDYTGIYYRWQEITIKEKTHSIIEFKKPYADGKVTRITDERGRTLRLPAEGGEIEQASLGENWEPYATAHRMVGIYKHVPPKDNESSGHEFAIFSDEGTLCDCEDLWSHHPLDAKQVTITFVNAGGHYIRIFLHPMGETLGQVIPLNIEDSPQVQMTVPANSRWCIRKGPYENSEALTSVVAAKDGQVLFIAMIASQTL